MALLWHCMACGMPYGMIIEIYLNFASFPMPYKCHMVFVVRGIDCRTPIFKKKDILNKLSIEFLKNVYQF